MSPKHVAFCLCLAVYLLVGGLLVGCASSPQELAARHEAELEQVVNSALELAGKGEVECAEIYPYSQADLGKITEAEAQDISEAIASIYESKTPIKKNWAKQLIISNVQYHEQNRTLHWQ